MPKTMPTTTTTTTTTITSSPTTTSDHDDDQAVHRCIEVLKDECGLEGVVTLLLDELSYLLSCTIAKDF
jgi:hypothetical protein